MSQNLFADFTSDHVEFNMKHLKTQLFMVLLQMIRQKGWSQSAAARELQVSAPRMSNLCNGYLEKFSIDMLMTMLVRIGYKFDADYNPDNLELPLVMNVKKAML
ncbi:helix-turn-helix domain-containing protein [Pseudomonas japonica]|uniref:Predicted DNA-binding protein, contains XRE-type HTH domain n=1 Tax=Pseudomonas japonica TaxID=256466 RepID=A0A239C7A0_9PSED|nr:XRE family transcriptional regulator [Pseudomonas japonica]SNS15990.1 Predicted DNA-binding protein, contains XRE-type HTH domain [Pseudomonas japonica]